MGIENIYFFFFVLEKVLIKEKDYVEGFVFEVVWVMRFGDLEFEEFIVIWFMSEMVMYLIFVKWICGYCDFFFRIN